MSGAIKVALLRYGRRDSFLFLAGGVAVGGLVPARRSCVCGIMLRRD